MTDGRCSKRAFYLSTIGGHRTLPREGVTADISATSWMRSGRRGGAVKASLGQWTLMVPHPLTGLEVEVSSREELTRLIGTRTVHARVVPRGTAPRAASQTFALAEIATGSPTALSQRQMAAAGVSDLGVLGQDRAGGFRQRLEITLSDDARAALAGVPDQAPAALLRYTEERPGSRTSTSVTALAFDDLDNEYAEREANARAREIVGDLSSTFEWVQFGVTAGKVACKIFRVLGGQLPTPEGLSVVPRALGAIISTAHRVSDLIGNVGGAAWKAFDTVQDAAEIADLLGSDFRPTGTVRVMRDLEAARRLRREAREVPIPSQAKYNRDRGVLNARISDGTVTHVSFAYPEYPTREHAAAAVRRVALASGLTPAQVQAAEQRLDVLASQGACGELESRTTDAVLDAIARTALVVLPEPSAAPGKGRRARARRASRARMEQASSAKISARGWGNNAALAEASAQWESAREAHAELNRATRRGSRRRKMATSG